MVKPAQIKTIGSHRFTYQNGLLTAEVIGEFTLDHFDEYYAFLRSVLDCTPDKINFIVDLNQAGYHSSEVRIKLARMSEDPQFDKIALHGLTPVVRVFAAFVVGVSRKTDLKFFTNRDEALRWLGVSKEIKSNMMSV